VLNGPSLPADIFCEHADGRWTVDFCHAATGVAARQHLRATSRRLLDVPRYWSRSFDLFCAWSVAMELAALPDYIRQESVGKDSFRRHLKTLLLASYRIQRVRDYHDHALKTTPLIDNNRSYSD